MTLFTQPKMPTAFDASTENKIKISLNACMFVLGIQIIIQINFSGATAIKIQYFATPSNVEVEHAQ